MLQRELQLWIHREKKVTLTWKRGRSPQESKAVTTSQHSKALRAILKEQSVYLHDHRYGYEKGPAL